MKKFIGYTLNPRMKVGITFISNTEKDGNDKVYTFKPKTKKVPATVVLMKKKISVLEFGVERGFLIRLYE